MATSQGSFDISVVQPGPGYFTQVAGGLSAGQWGQLNTNTADFYDTGFGVVTEYGTRAVWLNGELHLRGGGHSGTQDPNVHARWNETTSRWDQLYVDPNVTAHTYDLFTWNEQTSDLYFANHGGGDASKMIDHGTTAGVWTPLSLAQNAWPFSRGFSTLCYFPTLNAGAGGFVYYDSWCSAGDDTRGQLWVSAADLVTWRLVQEAFFPVGQSYHNGSCYLHAHDVVIFGGGNGSSAMAQLTPGETLTLRNDAPRSFGPGDPHQGTLLSDPTTGRIFLVSGASQTIWEHNYTADTWSVLTTLPFPAVWLLAGVIPDLGCLWVLGGPKGNSHSEFLYKF